MQSISQYEKMTTTPVFKLVADLAFPSVISMLVTTIYNLADTAFVGQLGNSASGAVGVVFGVMAILQAVAFTFGQGGGSLMSRSLGHQDTQSANRYASTAFFLSLTSAIVLAALGLLFLPQLITLLGSTSTIQPYAEDYCFWILLAAPFIVCSHTMNNLLRYEGKAALSMVALLAGALLNIAADPLFIFVFKMGVAGAGLATALSQVVGFFLLLSIYWRKKTQCALSPHFLFRDLRKISDMVFTGFPSLIRQGLNSSCTIMLNSTIRVYGDAAISAMSIVSRIAFFLFAVCLGIGQGFQPVSSFNYGAGKFSRVRKAYASTLVLAAAAVAVLSTLCLFFSSHLIVLFRNDADVIRIGTRALVLQCLAMYTQPVSMATEMLLQSTGKKWQASLLSAFKNGLFFLPALYLLEHLRGIQGVQEAQPVAYLLSAILCLPFAIHFFHHLPQKDAE